MVFEYVPGGSLLDFLSKNQNKLKTDTLLKLAIDAARGMVYLEKRGVVHRDLAARNLLIDTDRMQVKVRQTFGSSLTGSDFGMSRANMYQSSDTTVPIRWAAPVKHQLQLIRTGSSETSSRDLQIGYDLVPWW